MKEAFECIIERLEDIAKGYVYSSDAYEQGKFFAYSNATEIVKEVAEEEENDCCEWKNAGISDNWKPSCEPNSTYNVFGVAWFRRCPYCGKKIKVVE